MCLLVFVCEYLWNPVCIYFSTMKLIYDTAACISNTKPRSNMLHHDSVIILTYVVFLSAISIFSMFLGVVGAVHSRHVLRYFWKNSSIWINCALFIYAYVCKLSSQNCLLSFLQISGVFIFSFVRNVTIMCYSMFECMSISVILAKQ